MSEAPGQAAEPTKRPSPLWDLGMSHGNEPHDAADSRRTRTRNVALAALALTAVAAATAPSLTTNNKPREEALLHLTETDLDNDLTCAREAFADFASPDPIAGTNEWFEANCQHMKAEIETALASEQPLENIAAIKDGILARAKGINPGDIVWYRSRDGRRMREEYGNGFNFQADAYKAGKPRNQAGYQQRRSGRR